MRRKNTLEQVYDSNDAKQRILEHVHENSGWHDKEIIYEEIGDELDIKQTTVGRYLRQIEEDGYLTSKQLKMYRWDSDKDVETSRELAYEGAVKFSQALSMEKWKAGLVPIHGAVVLAVMAIGSFLWALFLYGGVNPPISPVSPLLLGVAAGFYSVVLFVVALVARVFHTHLQENYHF